MFATNRLTVVTPPGNPGGVEDVSDLEEVGTLSLCVSSAPCGEYAERVLSAAGVELDEGRVSRGQDVRATLGAVSRGDADAAIVYQTDAAAAGDAVETVPLPGGLGGRGAVPDRGRRRNRCARGGRGLRRPCARPDRAADPASSGLRCAVNAWGGPEDRRSTGVLLVVVAVAVALGLLVLPLFGLLERVSWSTLLEDLSSPAALSALRLSLVCSLGATVMSVTLGFPVAWALARWRFPGRAVVRALVLVPLVLPPVVGGVALLSAFGRTGLVGRYLFDWFGVQLTFSTFGAVLAGTFVALPFFVLTAEVGLRGIDRRYEEVATTLGAGPRATVGRVTLPMLMPSLVAGAVLAWARALGEFGATITFAGNIEGRTRTLPLAVYLLLDTDPEVALALSVVLLVLSLTVIVALRDRWTAGMGPRG